MQRSQTGQLAGLIDQKDAKYIDETGLISALVETKMKYKVHVFKLDGENLLYALEQFLNNLEGEVVSIIPKIKKLSLAQIYGITERVDYLLIVEKIAK
jgi:hypothetical protein